MHLQTTFFLTAGGLFDFDLTFVAEAFLFLLLAFVVTFVFLSPVSKQLDLRAESINYSLRKASLYITLGYNRLSNCLDLLVSETTELSRQFQLLKQTTTKDFETEISSLQNENARVFITLKGTLSVQSALLVFLVHEELAFFINSFFKKKFQSS